MKLFIWNRIENCTNNYHREGGVVVIAEDEAQARQMFKDYPSQSNHWDNGEETFIADDEAPDAVIDVTGRMPNKLVYVFPNAGCC